MEKTLIRPLITSNEIIVQFSNNIIIDKSIYVTVPATYKAILFINEEAISRIDECENQSIFKKLNKNRSYLKKNLKIAFFRLTTIPSISWGVGGINISNDEETYVIGSSGEIQIEIDDRIKFIKNFGINKNISIDNIREKAISFIQEEGKSLFSNYFSNNNIKYDDVDKYIKLLKESLFNSLNNTSAFKNLGIKIINLNIKTLIKNELKKKQNNNPEVSFEDFNSFKKEVNKKFMDVSNKILTKDEIDEFKNEIIEKVDDLSLNSINQDDLNELRENIENKLDSINLDDDKNSINELYDYIKGLEERLNGSLNTKIDDIKQIYDNYFEEKEQNKLDLYEKAKSDYINNLKITTDLLIEKSKSDEDLAAPAGVIYTNVENNLNNHPNLINRNGVFITSQDNYYEAAKKIMSSNISLLNGFNKRIYETKDGIDYIEVPTEFRFIIYGLSVEDAFKAAKDWTLINKCRHLSAENESKLKGALKDRGVSRKQFLKNTLEFYRRVKLFTKD